jgi:hypothetical protein
VVEGWGTRCCDAADGLRAVLHAAVRRDSIATDAN